MVPLYLVRHGQASASYADAIDPGLSQLGAAQAAETAKHLLSLGPLNVLSSPLARARETASAYTALTGQTAQICPQVSEIPSPGLGLSERGAWLRQIFEGTWPEAGADALAWTKSVAAFLAALTAPSVIFTHFVAINVAVGAATGDARAMIFRPDYASVTRMTAAGGRLQLIALGAEAQTIVR